MAYKDKERQRAAQAAWYQKHKAEYTERNRQRRKQVTALVTEIKESNPCTDCGQFFLGCQMQFDHIGTDKIKSVSDTIRYNTLPKVLAELAKCELVCANCHALRTWQRKFSEPLDSQRTDV